MPETTRSNSRGTRVREIGVNNLKRHTKITYSGVSQWTGLPYSDVTYDVVTDMKISGKQFTVSEGHDVRALGKGSRDNIGGPFYTYKQYMFSPVRTQTVVDIVPAGGPGGERRTDYSGPILAINPDISSGNYMTPEGQSQSTLDRMGTTAIAQTKPDNPIASATTAVGEIVKDGLPHLPGSQLWEKRAKAYLGLSHEFLNAAFGWLPLANDIADFSGGVANAHAVLSQYERDAGKVVRRGFSFPLMVDFKEDTFDGQGPWGPETSSLIGTTGKLTRSVETTTRVWFKGGYTYYLPTDYDSRNEMERLALLADRLGGSITPETLWELTPWSWAVDWFSNAGDVVSNVNSFAIDGLVLKYGYVMAETITKKIYTLDGVLTPQGRKLPVDPVILITHVKQRVPASPYGFGISWDGLSSFQASILAALGITKGGR